MYFVYARKGEGFKTYNEYYAMSEDVDVALEDAIQRIEDTGEEHFVRELYSWPSRLSSTVENGGVFRPYVHNGNGEDRL